MPCLRTDFFIFLLIITSGHFDASYEHLCLLRSTVRSAPVRRHLTLCCLPTALLHVLGAACTCTVVCVVGRCRAGHPLQPSLPPSCLQIGHDNALDMRPYSHMVKKILGDKRQPNGCTV